MSVVNAVFAFCVASIDCFSDGGRSVAVNTSGCGPEDRGFESLRPPHHCDDDGFVVLVVGDIYCCARSSGDRASGFEPEGRGFESLRACHIGFTLFYAEWSTPLWIAGQVRNDGHNS